ncbi:uncharacterized protein BO88DRAFT_32119 [Aspergillus vadensis CBS 113365]|uniref:Uncharacterized protein n=1 Tax=Aspergillus vadensis (strain CBS 113365 / IMI 142717 / IBT 24658) TaxID=1448311 RepID=A0A319BR20_ASPVC|nr:hypothetical protein BO88DRAFT_32119 [Aspergillus vadensis CBS 113365]PYH75175.1 hypothetical protein BO88DRAFT_32119 [Aspergillus vadensis CBS 113365]
MSRRVGQSSLFFSTRLCHQQLCSLVAACACRISTSYIIRRLREGQVTGFLSHLIADNGLSFHTWKYQALIFVCTFQTQFGSLSRVSNHNYQFPILLAKRHSQFSLNYLLL